MMSPAPKEPSFALPPGAGRNQLPDGRRPGWRRAVSIDLPQGRPALGRGSNRLGDGRVVHRRGALPDTGRVVGGRSSGQALADCRLRADGRSGLSADCSCSRNLRTVIAAQAMLGAASAVIPPTIAALSLGLVGRRLLDARVSRNEGLQPWWQSAGRRSRRDAGPVARLPLDLLPGVRLCRGQRRDRHAGQPQGNRP